MADQNSFGLSRYIPDPIKREVRERCGFGCVVCGSAIVDYEHFNPEFKDAKAHDAAGIILLCPLHHRAKGAFIARDTIAKAAENPFCKGKGFAWNVLDLQSATTHIGPFTAQNCEVVLKIQAVPVIWFSPPEMEGGPNRLNLVVRSRDGSDLVQIVDNVWSVSASADDVNLTSGNISGLLEVKDEDGPVFKARITPPDEIEIEVYRSWIGGHHYGVGRDTHGCPVVSRNGQLIFGEGSVGNLAINCHAAASIA